MMSLFMMDFLLWVTDWLTYFNASVFFPASLLPDSWGLSVSGNVCPAPKSRWGKLKLTCDLSVSDERGVIFSQSEVSHVHTCCISVSENSCLGGRVKPQNQIWAVSCTRNQPPEPCQFLPWALQSEQLVPGNSFWNSFSFWKLFLL